MKYVIGIDGGGTKTEACAFSLDGEIIATGMSGFGNVLVDAPKAISNIIDSINKCTKDLDMNDCLYIYLGLAGIDSGLHRKELEKELSKFNVAFQIANDARIAHAGMLKGKEGILTIAGTGSIAYGIKNNEIFIGGGWGNLLGDEGSGYWIAIQAFKQMINDYENRQPLSNLSKKILDKLEFKEVNQIKSFIYSSSKDEIASMVPIIVEQAKNNDRSAINILETAGKELGLMCVRLCQRMDLDSNVTIAIKGSILINIEIVNQTFINTIKKEIVNPVFIFNQESATVGAYFLALNEIKKGE